MVDIYARLVGDRRILAFIHSELGEEWCDVDEAEPLPTHTKEAVEIDYGYFDSKSQLRSFISTLTDFNLNIKVQVELYTSNSNLDDAFDWYVLTHDPESEKANTEFTAYHSYMPKPSTIVALQNQPEALEMYLKELKVVRDNVYSWDDKNISLSHEHMLTLSLNN